MGVPRHLSSKSSSRLLINSRAHRKLHLELLFLVTLTMDNSQ